jgi:hypothetical protein
MGAPTECTPNWTPCHRHWSPTLEIGCQEFTMTDNESQTVLAAGMYASQNVCGETAVEAGWCDTCETCSRELAEFVPVIFARDVDQAEKIKSLLEDCGIPTLVDVDDRDLPWPAPFTPRVPLLVPEELQDTASEIVAEIENQPAAGFDEDDMDDDSADDGFAEDDEFEEDDDEEGFDDDDDF